MDERHSVIEHAVSLSEGLSGRDIRNAMRLALPKAVLETPPQLRLTHIDSALSQIRDAYNAVSPSDVQIPPHINTARKMLGLS